MDKLSEQLWQKLFGRYWGPSLFITLAIALIAAVAAWVLYDSYPGRLEASALTLAAIMMGWSAWQGRSLAYLTKERIEAEAVLRRPYLNLDNWHLPEPTNTFRWRVDLKNFGSTPAYATTLEVRPRLPNKENTLQFIATGAASALIMPGQWTQWTIDLGSIPQQTQLEVDFIIRYRNASRKPYTIWELRLTRTPNPAISNWMAIGEDEEMESLH